jgi:hypothetical protein
VRFDERKMENEMEGAMEDGKKSTSATEEGRVGFSYWMLTRMPFCERSYSVLFVILRYQRTRARLDDPCRVGGFPASCRADASWTIDGAGKDVVGTIKVKKPMVIWDVDGI